MGRKQLPLILIIIAMLLTAIGLLYNDSQKDEDVKLASEYEYEYRLIQCSPEMLSADIVAFNSGDPSYKRVTWQYTDNEEDTVDYIIETLPSTNSKATMDATINLYENNADGVNVEDGEVWDKKCIATYNVSEIFPDGVTMRVYFFSYGDKFYIITFEQHRLLEGEDVLKMTDTCDQIVCDTIELLKGE